MEKKSSAVSGVVPSPPAEFSAFATTTSMPCVATSPGSRARNRSRPILPITSPTARIFKRSLGVVDRAGLADHAHAHLAGIGRLVLDALGDVLGQEHRLLVGDLGVLHQDAQL